MAYFSISLLLILVTQGIIAPPVSKTKEKEEEEVAEIHKLEYNRYLDEVVNALESDPDFRKKLETAKEGDIGSGKIADELEFVSHHIRTKLDEIKRVELQRLKEFTEKKRQLMNGNSLDDPNHHGHIDHSNPHTFEIEDLKKLIAKTREDLQKADKERKEQFKEYELQKEYDKQMKLNGTNGSEREKLEKEFKEQETLHKKHEKLHEPGHKAQLQEVWEEQDQMQQEFDPKTFFMLHDLDSNGLWDQDEVKALFVKELEKLYEPGHPEDDMRERVEEMERMREAVFQEVDTNRDGFIDYDEFLQQTKRNDFQEDKGWAGLDEKKPYTNEEYEAYARQHEMMMRQQGIPPPPPGYGYHPNMQYPGGQVPMGHPNDIPQGQYHPGQMPPPQQGQFHPGQIAQNHPQQLPGHLPDLNTNEIYPNQQRQYQQQQPPNVQYNNPPNPNMQQQHQNQPQYAQQNIPPNAQYNTHNQPNIQQQQQQQYQNPQGSAGHQQQNVPQQQQQQQQQQYQNPQGSAGHQPQNVPQQQQQRQVNNQQPPQAQAQQPIHKNQNQGSVQVNQV